MNRTVADRLLVVLMALIFAALVGQGTAGTANAAPADPGAGNPEILEAVKALQTSVNALQTTEGNLQTTVNNLQTVVNGIKTVVNGIVSSGAPSKLRRYYLTKDKVFDGTHALTACAAGFHMASLWEIFQTGNLQYDTDSTLALTTGDSGQGPVQEIGWIRTGNESSNANVSGTGNCSGWTTNSSSAFGTEVTLPSGNWFTSFDTITHPWVNTQFACNNLNRVWCVEDYR